MSRYWAISRRFAAAISLVLLLMATLPAQFARSLLPDGIGLSGLSGTIWSGRASRSWLVIGDQLFMLGEISWQFIPWRFLWGFPLSVSSEWGDQKISASVRLKMDGSFEASNVACNMDISFVRLLFPVQVGGILVADIETFSINQNASVRDLRGVIGLKNAIWTARSGSLPLGNYRVDFDVLDQKTGVVTGIFSTEEGALRISGNLELTEESYKISLNAAGPAARNDGLMRAVSMLAEPTVNGFMIALEGLY